MTREESIENLIERAVICGEQEPCEHAINLETVIEWLKAKDIIKLFSQEETARKELKALLPVNPQEPKTGHWIGEKAYPICSKCNCNIIEEYISCSDYAEMYKPMNYCPNCGARMVEPPESEG